MTPKSITAKKKKDNYPIPLDDRIIIIDNREKRSGIPDVFHQHGWKVVFMQLPSGDYIFRDIVIERKTPQDYIHSLYNNRLFKEIQQMKEDPNNFKHIYVVVQGDMSDLMKLTRNPKIAHGSVISCELRGANVHFTGSQDPEWFYNYITTLFAKHYDKKDREVFPFIVRKSAYKSEVLLLLNVLVGYKFIGRETAEKLLRHFGTIKRLHEATIDELTRVEGIGKKKAKYLYYLFNFDVNDPFADLNAPERPEYEKAPEIRVDIKEHIANQDEEDITPSNIEPDPETISMSQKLIDEEFRSPLTQQNDSKEDEDEIIDIDL